MAHTSVEMGALKLISKSLRYYPMIIEIYNFRKRISRPASRQGMRLFNIKKIKDSDKFIGQI